MERPRRIARLSIAFALSTTMLLCCCRDTSDRAEVVGNVELDGLPLQPGSILFIPQGTTVGAVTGARIENGRFRIPQSDGPSLGLHRVEIRGIREGVGNETKGKTPFGTLPIRHNECVSKLYNESSTLSIVIHRGTNTASFHVTGEPSRSPRSSSSSRK